MEAARVNWVAVDDCLRGEPTGEVRHEHVAGLVYAMAVASEEHNDLALNLATARRAHRRGGLGAFAGGGAHGAAEPNVEGFPGAIAAPPPEVMIDRLPGAEVFGQEPPGTTGPQQMEQGVDTAAPVGGVASAFVGWRQQRLAELPLGAGQAGGTGCVLPPPIALGPRGASAVPGKTVFQTRS